MSHPRKIATCCYCGTRAVLVLGSGQRHELACSSCGAPLHDMKRLPTAKVAKARAAPAVAISHQPRPDSKGVAGSGRRKPRRSLWSRALEEAFDMVEDLFD